MRTSAEDLFEMAKSQLHEFRMTIEKNESVLTQVRLDLVGVIEQQKSASFMLKDLDISVRSLLAEHTKTSDKIRSIYAEEMARCPAYQFVKRRGDGDDIDETTHEVQLHKEQIDSLRDRNSRLEVELERLRKIKTSIPPRPIRSHDPWWAPSAAKIIALIVAALGTAGGLGAWGVHCSSTASDEKKIANTQQSAE